MPVAADTLVEDFSQERWLPIAGANGDYEVSDYGRIRSLPRTIEFIRNGLPVRRTVAGGILKHGKSSNGYLTVTVFRGRPSMIQELVADAFLGPRPDGMMILHRDDVRSHNRLTNLYYGSRLQNIADEKRLGTYRRNYNATLTADQVSEIRGLLGTASQIEIAARYGVTHSNISAIACGRSWKEI